ncbi:MAG: DNRLRE domain-containing protein [Polyangiaceae bacterium]|nr:DNRLRE domain-containing protein [Polyangiaceae bacterium]
MARFDLATQLTLALFVSAAALGSAACVGQTTDEPDEELGESAEAASSYCHTYQRGVEGDAADASVWQSAPSYNDGAYTFLFTGTSSAGFKQSLLYFDISNVPAGATVTSATLYLYKSWKDEQSYIDVHEVLAPWDESTVTWANFNGAFDPVASTSFQAWSGVGGQQIVHVEPLVQGWVDGASTNHGFLLQDLDNKTSFHGSEHATVASRPKLRVCYTTE